MFALKLSLVAGSVLLASLVSRRFGHTAAGMLAGLPMIAGPIMGLLLIDLTPEHARAIALATLAALPAMALHFVVFAQAAKRWSWPVCLLLANGAFFAAGAVLMQQPLWPWATGTLAFLAPALALRALAGTAGHRTPVPLGAQELALRVCVALALAATMVLAARWLPPAASGLLLAMPVTANVLPCFALAFQGAPATRALMAGFARGIFGFAAFFAGLYVLLPLLGAGAAFIAACAAALAAVAAVAAVLRGPGSERDESVA